jgi:Ca2+-binding RTX toxin-like protein
VTSSPGGIDCGTTCSYGFVEGTVVTITPTAAAGSVFSGWSGACAGTPANSPCVLTLTSDLGATATFTAVPSYAVTVTKAGTGAGSVGSSPPGVSCGSTCSASFLSGTGVTLTAVPDSGSAFGGWSGACSGTGTTCNLAVDAAKAVTATFASSGGAAPPSGDCTITGTSGNDTLTGTNGDDVICGLAGNDTIRALGGDDEVDGGPGNDTIYGGAGKDDLRGGRGADRLLGGPAKDVLVGGRGVDRAVGGKGTDRCSAEVKVTCP